MTCSAGVLMWTATSTKFPLCWSSLLSRHVGWVLGGSVTAEKTAYFSLPLVCSVSGPPTQGQFISHPNLPLLQKFKKVARHSAKFSRRLSFTQNCARMPETQTKTSGRRGDGGLEKTKSVTNTGFQPDATASKSNDPTKSTTKKIYKDRWHCIITRSADWPHFSSKAQELFKQL